MRDVRIIAAVIVALGLTLGGFLLGDGMRRAHRADRSVEVKGLAERDVTADLAVWTIAYSAQAPTLDAARADIDADTAALTGYFARLGFPATALRPSGAGVSTNTNNGVEQVTVRQRLQLRTGDIARAQAAVARQFELVRAGVQLDEGSAMQYSFTKLNAIKPAMVAAATRDARHAAEQFAKDSGTDVGGIKSASQGYFSIEPRDGTGGEYGNADNPFKKVRVVTTIDFYLG